jgi:3-phosphoshikimate 1-carboxyvinyltransferase
VERTIRTRRGPLETTVRVPGSKSITQRALVCAALAAGESRIRNASDSDDTALMINGLNQLGILVRREGNDLMVEGKGGRIHAPKFPIPVGNAGTTLRFLMGVAALADGPVGFAGGGRMSERPVEPLLESLRALGVETTSLGFAGQWTVGGGGLRGGEVRVRGDISSQFVSSLLMVAPCARGEVRITVEGETVSEPYVAMTIDVMKRFGARAEREADGPFVVTPDHSYKPGTISIEPDASAAAFFLTAAGIVGGNVTVRGLGRASIQGDIGIVKSLLQMGCTMGETSDGLSIASQGRLKGIDVLVKDTPDLAPVLAIAALFADGPTRLKGAPHLRDKESDRIEVLGTELRKLGANITLFEDGIGIEPAPLTGAVLDPHGDHRLAMSFALIGLKIGGIAVEDSGCVKKSFPRFWEEFEKLEGSS